MTIEIRSYAKTKTKWRRVSDKHTKGHEITLPEIREIMMYSNIEYTDVSSNKSECDMLLSIIKSCEIENRKQSGCQLLNEIIKVGGVKEYIRGKQ